MKKEKEKEKEELRLPRYVFYDSKELKILCAAEHAEPIAGYIKELLTIDPKSSISTDLLLKKSEIVENMRLLKEYVCLINNVIAATKEAEEAGATIPIGKQDT